MEKSMIPDYFACHPAWAGELSQIAGDIRLQHKFRSEFFKAYQGPAYETAQIKAFDPDEVYQINDNEFYSFSDGVRYRISAGGKRIALIPLKGTLYAGHSFSIYEQISEMIEAAKHPAYAGVLIEADSPGGYTKKMDKLEKAISEFPKPIGVFVSGNLNSAAAYVTAGADWIAGDINEKNSFGSVGVFAMYENVAEYNEKNGIKVAVIRSEGAVDKFTPNAYEPLPENGLDKIQQKVNQEGEKFLALMQNKRKIMGAALEEVKKGGEFNTDEAIGLGLADAKLTYEQAIEKIAINQIFV